jgi:hypothetical protein
VLLEAENRVNLENVPEPLKPYYVALYSEGKQNLVLHAMRGGLAAMRLGYDDRAKELFDQAIEEVESMQEGARQAERAKSKFVAEREKWFKGESYERAALYFYRGLLYLKDQDFGNAAACFKRSEIEDITGDDAKDFSGDWGSDELGLALASYKDGEDGDAEAALKRREGFHSLQGEVPVPTRKTNLLVVVEVGEAPMKYRAGQYKEQLKFNEQPSNIKMIRASFDDTKVGSAAAENLYVQATTRGKRQLDYILGDKASFKEDTKNAGVGLAAGAVAASQVDHSGIASGVLALASLGTFLASGATKAEADIREWNNLPDCIYMLNLEVPEGVDTIDLAGLDKDGNEVGSNKISGVQSLVKGKTLGVVFVRM